MRFICLLVMLSFGGTLRAETKVFTGTLRFSFGDHLCTPVYSWPRTLLSYPVDFSKTRVKPDELQLWNQVAGKPEPMQLAEVRMGEGGFLRFARVCFFSDLPAGAVRSFELRQGPAGKEAGVSDKPCEGGREIDGGKFRVRIPNNWDAGGAQAPGPILALDAGRGWIGDGRVLSPNRPVERLEVKQVEKGPLFQTWKMTYAFAGGGVYEAILKVIWNYDFLDFSENVTDLDEKDGAVFEQMWTNFTPNRRFGAYAWKCPGGGIGIDQPVTTEGLIEEPHWFQTDYVENPAKEMIFRLAAFAGNGVRESVPVMSFWDGREGGQELSVFVPDTKGWNDGQYTVWQPSSRQQVHFRFTDGVLYWKWPLVARTRRTGIELTGAAESQAAVEAMCKVYKDAAGARAKWAYKGKGNYINYAGTDTMPMRHAQLLRSWYGGLDLDRVKDWVLTNPQPEKLPENPLPDVEETPPLKEIAHMGKTAGDFETFVFHSSLMLYPQGLNLALLNLSHQPMRPMVEQYLKLRPSMSAAQRERIDAMFLLAAYVNSGEDLAPVLTCATGTPNMSAESYTLPALIAMLYPGHPMAAQWRDQFEKAVELQSCFYTRPAVPLWGAKGGRWAESLATYNWADLSVLEKSQTAAMIADGRNRLASRWMAERAEWMVDELSAPIFNPDPYWRQNGIDPYWQESGAPPARSVSPEWKFGMPLLPQYGFERQYPPHGAHGSGSGIPIPDMVPVLAGYLRRYSPLAAEHLFWAVAQSGSSGGGEFNPTAWSTWERRRIGANNGTNPHLASCKYTGHGLVLRAGVGTSEEVSVHLDQIDQGPNYRWGNNGEGSSGVLYFYAAGKVWAGHERENTGDHSNDDTAGTTTFGVLHDNVYRSIGANVLERPLFDLGVAQFGEITARRDHIPYSWPAYKSRSILLVGTDYMLITDDAEGPSRFSWFTMRDLPFPKIVFLSPLSTRTDHLTMVQTSTSKGLLRDAAGPSMVLVSHKADAVEMEEMTSKPCPVFGAEGIRQYAWARPKGSKTVKGVYKVRTASGHDWLFRDTAPVAYDEMGKHFLGEAGVIREAGNGVTELAMARGSEIGANGLTLKVPEADEVGISAVFKSPDHISGIYVAPKPSRLDLNAAGGAQGHAFYVDGARRDGFELPAGRHSWEWTAGEPRPQPPVITRTENGAGCATVFFAPAAGARSCRVEGSLDGGTTWQPLGETTSDRFLFRSPPGVEKMHVRGVALNTEQASEPGGEYPVYFSARPPLPPDGLSLILGRDRVDLSWGQLLGVREYRLYRRAKGDARWEKIYSGLARAYADLKAKGALPPFDYPGEENKPEGVRPLVYEYAVSAVDGNGEGAKSAVADSDPASWRNWWPAGQPRRFNRQTAFWLPPYVPPDKVPPRDYPGAGD